MIVATYEILLLFLVICGLGFATVALCLSSNPL